MLQSLTIEIKLWVTTLKNFIGCFSYTTISSHPWWTTRKFVRGERKLEWFTTDDSRWYRGRNENIDKFFENIDKFFENIDKFFWKYRQIFLKISTKFSKNIDKIFFKISTKFSKNIDKIKYRQNFQKI